MVLMATVEPCRKRSAAAKCVPALVTPASMPSTMARGVDRLLPRRRRLPVSSKAAPSGKEPPISAARRKRCDGDEELSRGIELERFLIFRAPNVAGQQGFSPY